MQHPDEPLDMTASNGQSTVAGWIAGPGVMIAPAADGRPNMIDISAKLSNDNDSPIIISR